MSTLLLNFKCDRVIILAFGFVVFIFISFVVFVFISFVVTSFFHTDDETEKKSVYIFSFQTPTWDIWQCRCIVPSSGPSNSAASSSWPRCPWWTAWWPPGWGSPARACTPQWRSQSFRLRHCSGRESFLKDLWKKGFSLWSARNIYQFLLIGREICGRGPSEP